MRMRPVNQSHQRASAKKFSRLEAQRSNFLRGKIAEAFSIRDFADAEKMQTHVAFAAAG
jgi:hypothetical protein